MLNLIEPLKSALRDYARYVETRREIERMPLDIALDLGLHRADAHRIARKTVWG